MIFWLAGFSFTISNVPNLLPFHRNYVKPIDHRLLGEGKNNGIIKIIGTFEPRKLEICRHWRFVRVVIV